MSENNQKSPAKKFFYELFFMTLGTVLMAIGIYFFKFPNHFSTGGVSGISVILSGIFPEFSSGFLMMAINVVLLVFGFIFVGNGFGLKTVYCSLLLSFLTYGLEFLIPLSAPITDEPLLELVFAIFFPAVGSALLFNLDASTGGTDIVAMIIRKHSDMNISKALMVSDVLIVMATVFVFGIKTWLFCVLGFAAKVFVMDSVIESLNTSKYFTIITDKPDEINDFITVNLHRGATMSKSYIGSYSHESKCVLLTVVARSQAVYLRKKVKEIDPHAFVIITNTGDIIGKGFREYL